MALKALKLSHKLAKKGKAAALKAKAQANKVKAKRRGQQVEPLDDGAASGERMN